MTYAKNPTAYGGELQKTRAGRKGPRPVSTHFSMHVVLRASPKAGAAPFARGPRADRVQKILKRFSTRNDVQCHRVAVNYNHIHLRARFPSLKAYKRFIRALTGTIAHALGRRGTRFWHYRPFSRVVKGERDEKIVDNYVHVNEWEAQGYSRDIARFLAAMKARPR